jgi:hypothetical protein
MKKILLISAAIAAVALAAIAASPSYSTLSAGGNATTGAYVIFPAAASQQVRVVGLNWESDTNAAVFSFRTGTGAYVITATNAAAATNIQVNLTNGLAAGSTIVLQKATGVTAVTTVYSPLAGSSTTNLFLPAGGFGVAAAIGDEIYLMSAATTVPVGATTNWQNGEALFVGTVGRPVRVLLTPALATNRINAAVARYE